MRRGASFVSADDCGARGLFVPEQGGREMERIKWRRAMRMRGAGVGVCFEVGF